jgi:hypothetical protein
MPTEIKVIISDEGLPIVLAALDKQNEFQQNAALQILKLDEWIQSIINGYFGITTAQLAERKLAVVKEEILSGIGKMDETQLKKIAAAVAAEAKP